MFGWLKKEKAKVPDNIYSVLDNELSRLWSQFNKADQKGNVDNMNAFYTVIKGIHEGLQSALKKQPTSDEQLKDLQDSVADLYLTGKD